MQEVIHHYGGISDGVTAHPAFALLVVLAVCSILARVQLRVTSVRDGFNIRFLKYDGGCLHPSDGASTG